jgi:hypothetical protein
MKLSRSRNSTKKPSQIYKFLFLFDNQYPAIKPQGFIKSEIQGKLQTPPTNFSPSNQDLRLLRTKLSQNDFQFPKSPQETFSKKSREKNCI